MGNNKKKFDTNDINDMKFMCIYLEAEYLFLCKKHGAKNAEDIIKEIRNTFGKEEIDSPTLENYEKQISWYILWQTNLKNKVNFFRGGIAIPQFERPEDMRYFYNEMNKTFPSMSGKKFSDYNNKELKITFIRNPKYAT